MSAWMNVGSELNVDWDDAVLLALERRRRPRVPGERELEDAPAGDGNVLLKDDPDLRAAPLEPLTPIELPPVASPKTQQLAAMYNHLGGLLDAVAHKLGLDVATAGALWFVESGGRAHEPGQLRQRLDVDGLWRQWGKRQPARFAQAFRRGAGGAGQLREHSAQPFRALGDGQTAHVAATRLAARVAGKSAALKATRVGAAALPLSAHRALGYASPVDMRDAFDADERTQVLSFFDHLASLQALPEDGSVSLLDLARTGGLTAIAARLHGPADAPSVAAELERARTRLMQLLAPPLPSYAPTPRSTIWLAPGTHRAPHRHSPGAHAPAQGHAHGPGRAPVRQSPARLFPPPRARPARRTPPVATRRREA